LAAIAAHYASAFADAVLAPASGLDAQTALREIRDFQEAVRQSVELRNALSSPAVQNARKRAVAGRIADNLGLSRLSRNLIFVLVRQRRTRLLLGELSAALEAVFDARAGRVRAEVASAAELTLAQKQKMAADLSRIAGRQVRCEYKVMPELIGGAMARIGTTVYDGSVRGQLDGLRQRLLQ